MPDHWLGCQYRHQYLFCLHFWQTGYTYFISLLLTCLMGLLITLYAFLHFLPESARKTAQNTDPLFYHHRSFCGPVWLYPERWISLIGYNPERLKRLTGESKL